jgi:hypothetical protein
MYYITTSYIEEGGRQLFGTSVLDRIVDEFLRNLAYSFLCIALIELGFAVLMHFTIYIERGF